MSRRRHQSSNLPKWLWSIAIISALLFGSWRAYQYYFGFNHEAILNTSILKEKSFEKQPIEVISPKYKIKAYLLEDNTNPIISLSFMFSGSGLSADNNDEYGIANVVSALLLDGTENLDTTALKEKMESLAIGISFNAGLDDFSGSLATTSDNQAEAYQLLKDIFTHPRFEEKDLSRLKSQLENAFLRQREHPASILGLEYATFLYENHPYGRNPLGDWNKIKNFTPSDLRAFMSRRLAQSNLIIGVAGDISPQKLGEVLDDVFGILPEKAAADFVRPADIKFDGRRKNIEGKTGQNISSFAVLGTPRNAEDFYPLYVANHIFGGAGINSRLAKAAREKEGLTYSIYTYLSLADKSPLLQGGFSSTSENYNRVWEIINREWQTFNQNGATAQEVKAAKDYLISSYNLRFASIDNLSEILVAMQKENLGLDFLQKRNDNIKKVTAEQVSAAAHKYFATDSIISANIGKFSNN